MEKLVTLTDLRQAECPISTIYRYPEMDMLVTEILNMVRVKEFTGSVPFGNDSAKWPARWYDAVKISFNEDCRFENEREQVRDSLRSS